MSLIPDVPPRPSNQAAPAPNLAWPPGKQCAVFNSFDVDSESAWIAHDVKNVNRLVTMSFGGYEARVGVPRRAGVGARIGQVGVDGIPRPTVRGVVVVQELDQFGGGVPGRRPESTQGQCGVLSQGGGLVLELVDELSELARCWCRGHGPISARGGLRATRFHCPAVGSTRVGPVHESREAVRPGPDQTG